MAQKDSRMWGPLTQIPEYYGTHFGQKVCVWDSIINSFESEATSDHYPDHHLKFYVAGGPCDHYPGTHSLTGDRIPRVCLLQVKTVVHAMESVTLVHVDRPSRREITKIFRKFLQTTNLSETLVFPEILTTLNSGKIPLYGISDSR